MFKKTQRSGKISINFLKEKYLSTSLNLLNLFSDVESKKHKDKQQQNHKPEIKPELGTFVLWILRSMLDLDLFQINLILIQYPAWYRQGPGVEGNFD